MFNQIDTLENHLCVAESVDGMFCAEWEITKESTHNYMNTIVLVVLLPLVIYLTIRLFLKPNYKR